MKARQYLAQARVKVVRVAPADAVVLVQGSKEEPYTVRLVGDVWTCTCEARTWRCAHIVAARLVIPDDMEVAGFGPQLDGELNTLLDEPSVVAPDTVEDQDWADFVTTVEGWDGEEGP